MNQSEEMVALKKVYAEMILNTTKESAVRVMAAESKAHKCEKELAFTKEEAVRLLLRLKDMIDTQKKEAEARSLNDQRRIDELEAQLDEAEGLIIDLRAKLNNAEDQLESLKDKYKRLSSRKEIIYLPTHSKTPMDTQSYPSFPYSMSVSEPTPVISEIPASIAKPSILVHEGRTSQKDIPATTESKEPEVYGNGGCERVQESETISLPNPSTCDHDCITSSKEILKSSSGCHSGSVNSSVPASATIKSNELYENEHFQKSVSIETSLPDEQMQTAEESEPKPKKKRRNAKTKSLSCLRTDKLGMKDSLRNDITAKDQHGKFHKLPRRTVRYGRVKVATSKRRSAKIVMPQRKSVAFTRCKSSVSGNACKSDDTPKSEPELKEKLQPKKFDAVSVVRRSIRNRKVKDWDTLEKAACLNDKNVERQVIACQDVLKGDDLSVTHEGISVKEAAFNADTLENSPCGNSLEDDVKLVDVVIVEQPKGLASHMKSENRCTAPVTHDRIHVKKAFVNAGTLAGHEENSACGGTSLYDDANLIDVVITEAPNGLASHMKLENTCTVGIHAKEAFVNADTLTARGGNSLEDDVNLIDVVILQQPPNGHASRMKLDNTCPVPVDCKISEANTSRTIIHTFSRKRKNRSLVPCFQVNPSEECSLKKQRGDEGNDGIVLISGNKNLADESYGDSRISSMQAAPQAF